MQNQIHKLTEKNEILQSEVLSAEKIKSIITKVDGKTRSTACRKAIYSSLEYQAIIGLHFEHMWFVNNQNVLYQGHVLSVKCVPKGHICQKLLLYTGNDEGDDVTMTVYEFL